MAPQQRNKGFACLLVLFLAACSPNLAKPAESTSSPVPSRAPTTIPATVTPRPSPEPSPTPGLILPPAADFLPGAEDTGPDYQPITNRVSQNLSYFDQLPLPEENLATANFEYRGSNDLTGAQDGIYMRMTYWVAVAEDEDAAKFYYQISRSDPVLKQAFLVIMPSALHQQIGEVTQVEPGSSVCDEAAIGTVAFDLFEEYRTGQLPTLDPATDPHSQWFKPEQIARFPPDLYIYASCRVKNAVLLFWGWTMNNTDGQYTPLPAELVAQQVDHHFETIVEKMK